MNNLVGIGNFRDRDRCAGANFADDELGFVLGDDLVGCVAGFLGIAAVMGAMIASLTPPPMAPQPERMVERIKIAAIPMYSA